MVLRDYRTRCINSTSGYNVKLIRWLFQLVAFAGWYSQRERRVGERQGTRGGKNEKKWETGRRGDSARTSSFVERAWE